MKITKTTRGQNLEINSGMYRYIRGTYGDVPYGIPSWNHSFMKPVKITKTTRGQNLEKPFNQSLWKFSSAKKPRFFSIFSLNIGTRDSQSFRVNVAIIVKMNALDKISTFTETIQIRQKRPKLWLKVRKSQIRAWLNRLIWIKNSLKF